MRRALEQAGLLWGDVALPAADDLVGRRQVLHRRWPESAPAPADARAVWALWLDHEGVVHTAMRGSGPLGRLPIRAMWHLLDHGDGWSVDRGRVRSAVVVVGPDGELAAPRVEAPAPGAAFVSLEEADRLVRFDLSRRAQLQRPGLERGDVLRAGAILVVLFAAMGAATVMLDAPAGGLVGGVVMVGAVLYAFARARRRLLRTWEARPVEPDESLSGPSRR